MNNNQYALAGYGYDTETTVTTFPEERRQWRVKIEKHVSTEEQMTRDLVDERADQIDDEIADVKNYIVNSVVNTYLVPIKTNVASIKDTVEQTNSYVRGTLEGTQSEQNTLLQNIWNKVRYL